MERMFARANPQTVELPPLFLEGPPPSFRVLVEEGIDRMRLRGQHNFRVVDLRRELSQEANRQPSKPQLFAILRSLVAEGLLDRTGQGSYAAQPAAGGVDRGDGWHGDRCSATARELVLEALVELPDEFMIRDLTEAIRRLGGSPSRAALSMAVTELVRDPSGPIVRLRRGVYGRRDDPEAHPHPTVSG